MYLVSSVYGAATCKKAILNRGRFGRGGFQVDFTRSFSDSKYMRVMVAQKICMEVKLAFAL